MKGIFIVKVCINKSVNTSLQLKIIMSCTNRFYLYLSKQLQVCLLHSNKHSLATLKSFFQSWLVKKVKYFVFSKQPETVWQVLGFTKKKEEIFWSLFDWFINFEQKVCFICHAASGLFCSKKVR